MFDEIYQAVSFAITFSSVGVKHLIPSRLTRYSNISYDRAFINMSANWSAARGCMRLLWLTENNATYSAFAVDIAVQSCFFDIQLTSLSPRNCDILIPMMTHVSAEKISESSLDHEFKEFMDQEFYPRPTNRSCDETSSQTFGICFSEKRISSSSSHIRSLKDDEKKRLVFVLKKHKEAFAWKTSDIPGISPSFCIHKINFEDDAKPVIQRQRRLNPNMKEAVKKEIIKLLDAGIIYPIEDSPWVSPVHCVPKKGGMTVVTNEENELVPTRTVTGWRVCIEYHQEKITFTCPYGTYAYKRIPFGLCNAPATFQRCMIAIFQYILETSMEVFIDDVLAFGDSFDSWLEVDKAKIDVITKLPPPTNVKAVRSFLGHVRFYRRFIKDFSKIPRPMTKLLEKDAVFNFNKEGIEAFESLKDKLTNAPIMVSPDWSQPFELMCNANDFVFDIEIKNKKGAENVAAYHLSRLENPHLEELRDDDIDDNFPDKTLMNISLTEEDKIPWFTDFSNYLVGKILRKGLTYTQRCKFFSELKHYFWDEPYLFKMCPDEMIWRCVYGAKTRKILDKCHHGPTGGHYGLYTTTKKVFDIGFNWPTIFKEAHTLVQNCDACQRSSSLSRRDGMPQNNIQVSEIFSIWGIDFMGPFPKSHKFEYILVAIDYVSK
ncbi:reverse transcriptase domain-containing protein [Tanacetum coccineum]